MHLRTVVEFEAELPDGSPAGQLVSHELDRPFDDIRVRPSGHLVAVTRQPVGNTTQVADEPISYSGFLHLCDDSHIYIALFESGVMTSIRVGYLDQFILDDASDADILGIIRIAFSEGRSPPGKSIRALLERVSGATVPTTEVCESF